MKPNYHNLLWKNGSLISPFKHYFESPYDTIIHQFQKNEAEVLDVGTIELPLLSYKLVGEDDYKNKEYALIFYHPDLPYKMFRFRQRGLHVNKKIRALIKQLSDTDQIPIVSVTPDKTITLYDNNYTPPKIEITDYIDPTPEMTFLMDGGIIKQSYGVVFLIDADGVKREIEAKNDPAQIKMMFDLMLHFSESKTKDNGRKIRMILYDCLSYKEETVVNTMRSNFIKYGSLKDGQYWKVLGIYRKIIEVLMG